MKRTATFVLACVFSTVCGQNIDSLLNVWQDSSLPDTARLNAMHAVIWDGYLFTQPDSAVHFAGLAYEFAKTGKSSKHLAGSLNNLGAAFNRIHENDSALHFFTQALEIRMEIGDKTGAAGTLNNIGVIHYSAGEYDHAITKFEQSADIHNSEGNFGMEARTRNNIGLIRKKQGDYAQAIVNFMESLTIAENGTDHQLTSALLNNIGNLYTEQKDYDRALEYYFKCLSLAEENDDQITVVSSCTNIGGILSERGKFIEANEYNIRALKVAENTHNDYGESVALNNLGDNYKAQQQYDEALKFYHRSLDLKTAIGDSTGRSLPLANIAALYGELGEHESAIKFGSEALDIALLVDAASDKVNASYILYESFKATGRELEALQMYELFVATGDSIESEKNKEEFIRQEYAYNYDKKVAADKAVNEERIRQEKKQRSLLGAGIIMLILFLTYVYNRYRKSVRQKNKVERLSTELASTVDRLNVLNQDLEQDLREQTSTLAESHDHIQKIRSQLNLVEGTMDSSAYATFWINSKGQFIRTNEAARKLLDYSEEEFFNLTTEEIFTGSSYMTFEDYWNGVMQNELDVFEAQVKKSTGEKLWIEVYSKRISSHGEDFICGFAIDVTIRYLALERLKLISAHLQDLVTNVQGMIYQCNPQDSYAMYYVSDSCKELTGYEPNELIDKNRNWLNLIHPADRTLNHKQLAIDDSYSFTYRIIAKDGSTKWVYDHGKYVIKNEAPTLEGIVVDISERVGAEQRRLMELLDMQEKERLDIASELHDGLGQALSSTKMLLGSSAENKSNLKIIQQLDSAMTMVREFANRLMPKTVEHDGLASAINMLVHDLDSISETKFSFNHNLNGERFDERLESNLYRIVQEAINNCLKYAKASNCIVQLLRHENNLSLSIEDDGLGFDSSSLHKNELSLGFRTMTSRAHSLDGSLEIDSHPGKGTSIIAIIDL